MAGAYRTGLDRQQQLVLSGLRAGGRVSNNTAQGASCMVDHRPMTRSTLVAALSACAEGSTRARARRFLMGLSSDELQFIAEFVGACILESSEDTARVAEAIQRRCRRVSGAFVRQRDQENKMILLREFLCRSRGAAA